MRFKKLIYIVSFILFLIFSSKAFAALSSGIHEEHTILVIDANKKTAVSAAKVQLLKDGLTGGSNYTDIHGKVTVLSLHPGKYNIVVSCQEYDDFSDIITIDSEHILDTIALQPSKTVTTSEVTVTAQKQNDIMYVQPATGVQQFYGEMYHSSPTSGIVSLIQEYSPGTVKAPTGEVHIRGMHGEYTYYLDGIPIPLGVFGGLNETIDPNSIDRMTFMTGGFPAEYGGQTAAVMDIETKVPANHLHIDFSTYGGSYFVLNGTKPFSPGIQTASGNSGGSAGDTLGGHVGPFRAVNNNGQSLTMSDRIGNFGFTLTGSRQETDRRIDTPTETLFNDHGKDYFLYGKFDYIFSDFDYLTMNLSYSATHTQVPFNIALNGYSPDNQTSYNSFQTLSYYHTISDERNSAKKLFVGLYFRQGGLNYTPSPVSPVNFYFSGDSLTRYALTESRNFNTSGLRLKFDSRFSKEFIIKTGLDFSVTSGTDKFTSRDSLQRSGPIINNNFKGSDFGLFAEEEYQPDDWFRLDAGIRYDQHIAPDMNMQTQLSPRIKVNFLFDEANTFYIYYGRLFMPSGIEGLRQLASNVNQQGIATLPERDDFFEASYIHQFIAGLILKGSAFYKYASPGTDDQTIGSSSVKTPVNISVVRITGLELGLSYSASSIPLTGYLNASIIHAYGSGAITGGFLAINSDGVATDLDHDQRLSVVLGLTYKPSNWYVSGTAIYGSGLTNGNPNSIPYQTGLFDFNSQAHVNPYAIINISLGYIFHFQGETNLEPSIYINNLLDNNYLLKGAYFSAASWGERRNIVLKLALHI